MSTIKACKRIKTIVKTKICHLKRQKINIDEQMFECYYNNNRYDLCGQNYLSVWNLSKQDFIVVYIWQAA